MKKKSKRTYYKWYVFTLILHIVTFNIDDQNEKIQSPFFLISHVISKHLIVP